MLKKILFTFLFSLLFTFIALGEEKGSKNPLLIDWQKVGPAEYQGVPPFDQIKLSDFEPAIKFAMEEKRAEIKAITDNKDEPTFENTILAFEKVGNRLNKVLSIYDVWQGGLSTPEFQKLDEKISPMLSAFRDEMIQNTDLFLRIEKVYKGNETLSPEQKRLVFIDYQMFTMNGAKLPQQDKLKVKEINQKLAVLYTQFTNNNMADEEKMALILDKKEDLKGMTEDFIASAFDDAKKRGLKNKWSIANTRSAMEPFLTYAENRELRKKAFQIWTSRGDNKNKYNNNKIITQILNLRLERSKIFGFKNFADWSLQDTMAKTSDKALGLLMQVWTPALKKVQNEILEMNEIVKAEGKKNFKLEPWDYRYYIEKVRKKKYDFDADLLTPYLELSNIREAMFFSANKLYGFNFSKINDVPVFHPAVTVYKVTNKNNEFVGLWYFDPYARAGKKSGAWMSEYREQNNLDGKRQTAIVSNNSNFLEGKENSPVYISWDDANTMFHEFGHAIHGLSSNVTYPSLSGTNVPRDFVEFPSQINEKWLETPEVLKFLKNSKGETLPQEFIKKLEMAQNYNQGFSMVELLSSAIVDMKIHLSESKKIDPAKFEKETLKEINMPSEIVMRHRLPQFNHLFTSEGYAAGYYSYVWSEVLDFDAFDAFLETKDAYNSKVAEHFYKSILSVGNTIDSAEAYKNFRGRDPKVEPLLEAKGLNI